MNAKRLRKSLNRAFDAELAKLFEIVCARTDDDAVTAFERGINRALDTYDYAELYLELPETTETTNE